MTKRRKPSHGAKRKPITSSVAPHKTTAALRPAKANQTPHWRRWQTILPIGIALAIAAIPFGYGRYFELNNPGPYDSGAYTYSAYRVLNGAQIGVDEIPSAKLGTLLVNMLGVGLFGYSDIGPKIIQGILQAVALVLMLFSIRRIYGTLAGAVAITITAIYLSSPAIAKCGNVKEQYMIAFMVMGVSCLVLRQVGGRWFWAPLAGALVAWAPLFKETGMSAIAAMGLFVLIQPILKHRTLKQTGLDIGLLLAGAVVSMAPIFIWLDAVDARISRPYAFVWKTILPEAKPGASAVASESHESSDSPAILNGPANESSLAPDSKAPSGYLSTSRSFRGLAEQFPIVMRFYRLLILPIALSLGAIIARLIRLILRLRRRAGTAEKQLLTETGPTFPDRFVLLLAVWWLLDMAFVWISPRSYDQYYLPQNASGAMLGAYLIGLFLYHFKQARQKSLWIGLGAGTLILIMVMVWPIFVGVSYSPHHGGVYKNSRTGQPEKRRGYAQSLHDVAMRKSGRMGHWEQVARQVQGDPSDDYTIYVWGWYPGIYVAAGRISSASLAFESEMHTLPPETLSVRIRQLVSDLESNPPRFIIDTQKMHYPNYDHPVFDLWPRWLNPSKRILDLQPGIWNVEPKITYLTLPEMNQYRILLDAQVEQYCVIQLTRESRQDGPLPKEQAETLARQERARHEAMRPLREFVMQHYHPVPCRYGMFIFEKTRD